jgi:hypothetical protein
MKVIGRGRRLRNKTKTFQVRYLQQKYGEESFILPSKNHPPPTATSKRNKTQKGVPQRQKASHKLNDHYNPTQRRRAN